MPTLSDAQKAAVAKSIRTQYSKAKAYVPPKVARARALRLVLNKPGAKPKSAAARAARSQQKMARTAVRRNPFGALA